MICKLVNKFLVSLLVVAISPLAQSETGWWEYADQETREKCDTVNSLDLNSFRQEYGIEASDFELAELASNTDRFGGPDNLLALQIICNSSYWTFSPATFMGAVSYLYGSVNKGKDGGYDVCDFVTGKAGTAVCAQRKRVSENVKLARASVPFGGMRVEEETWGNWINPKSGDPIPSSCLATEWLSSDNFDAYVDHFDLEGDFREFPGRYFGVLPDSNPVPLKPFFYEKWELAVSLAQTWGDCNIEDPDGYQLKVLWPSSTPACSVLLPQIDSCHSMAYLEMNGMFGSYYNMYAVVTHEGEDYVVLVTNNLNLEELKLAGILPQ